MNKYSHIYLNAKNQKIAGEQSDGWMWKPQPQFSKGLDVNQKAPVSNKLPTTGTANRVEPSSLLKGQQSPSLKEFPNLLNPSSKNNLIGIDNDLYSTMNRLKRTPPKKSFINLTDPSPLGSSFEDFDKKLFAPTSEGAEKEKYFLESLNNPYEVTDFNLPSQELRTKAYQAYHDFNSKEYYSGTYQERQEKGLKHPGLIKKPNFIGVQLASPYDQTKRFYGDSAEAEMEKAKQYRIKNNNQPGNYPSFFKKPMDVRQDPDDPDDGSGWSFSGKHVDTDFDSESLLLNEQGINIPSLKGVRDYAKNSPSESSYVRRSIFDGFMDGTPEGVSKNIIETLFHEGDHYSSVGTPDQDTSTDPSWPGDTKQWKTRVANDIVKAQKRNNVYVPEIEDKYPEEKVSDLKKTLPKHQIRNFHDGADPYFFSPRHASEVAPAASALQRYHWQRFGKRMETPEDYQKFVNIMPTDPEEILKMDIPGEVKRFFIYRALYQDPTINSPAKDVFPTSEKEKLRRQKAYDGFYQKYIPGFTQRQEKPSLLNA